MVREAFSGSIQVFIVLFHGNCAMVNAFVRKCLKNLNLKIGYFQGAFRGFSGWKGHFKIPLLCPHPLPSFNTLPWATNSSQAQPWASSTLIFKIRSENSAQNFSDRSFGSPLGSWTSAPSGHGPRPHACFFSRILSARPDRSFGPGYPREWPPDVRGISVPKTSSLGWFFVLERIRKIGS